MTQLLVTLYMMWMATFSPIGTGQTVVEEIYSPDTSPITITVPTPSPTDAPVPDIEAGMGTTPLDYVQELKKLGFIKEEYEDPDLNIRNGVLRFQAAHNLLADGDFGPHSTAALTKRLLDENFQYTDSVQSPPTENYWILINKSRRILTLYQGKSVIKKYPLAIGNPPSLTPEGKYKIANKIVNPAWGGGGYTRPVEGGTPYNPLGYRWMGLNIGNGGDYGVHGNNVPYSIGTDASHGCIRMINPDVEELFEIVSLDTPVWITSDEGLEALGISQKEYETAAD